MYTYININVIAVPIEMPIHMRLQEHDLNIY